MNLESLSKEQLDARLRALARSTDRPAQLNELHQVVEELQVHRVELEMQNRALRDAQSELEHAVQRYADLYDHLPLPYVTITAIGQIVAANRAATEWLKSDAKGLVGTYFRKFLNAYDAGRFAAHIENCLRSGRRLMIELTMQPAAGDAVAVQISSRPAPAKPDTEAMVHLAITDVSQLKHAHHVLEEINQEQEAFNYSISHDLRAPLVTISNYARIVLTDHAAQMDDECRGMIQRIEGAALRMEQTLKNLLEYSALGREEIVLQAVDVAEVMRELLIEHRGLIQETAAEISVAPEMPLVRGSRVILNQVLANLLTNALKYTHPGQAPRVRVTAERGEKTVILHVADEGIGIEAKHHERIFRVFERLHGYSRYPGTGVGLAIARRAVERMSGRIWVESEPGKGSRFCIELPAA